MYVADGPDSRRGSLQVSIDLDEGAPRRDSRCLEIQTFNVSSPPRCDEDLVSEDLFGRAGRVLDDGRSSLAFPAHRCHSPAGPYDDPFLGKHRVDRFDHRGILAADDLAGHLHHGHFRAEPPKDLRKLDSDRTTSDDENGGWELIPIEEGCVVEKSRFGQPINRGNRSS